MRLLDSLTNSMDMNLSKLGDSRGQESGILQYMGQQRVEHGLVTEQQFLLCTKVRVAKSKESLING